MSGRACLEDAWPHERSVTVPRIGMAFDDYLELFGPVYDDNSSHQCPCSCLPCPDDQPLWWLILRWLKMMLLKVARSYNAKPLILVIAPLLAGIAIGYVLGGRQRSIGIGNHERNTQRLFSSHVRWLRIQDWVSISYLRLLGLWMSLSCDPSSRPWVDEKKFFGESNPPYSTIAARAPEVTLVEKEDHVRANLKSDEGMLCESGVDSSQVPRHVAVIMDGNRRYGKAKYGSVSRGHWDGSSKLVEFAKWCIAENISVLTVYAFSTENWSRDPSEVASLMAIFAKYSDELRIEALKRNIRIHVLSTDSTRIPTHVHEGLSRMKRETEHCTGLTMNICMSYGSRGEILNAVRSITTNAVNKIISLDSIDETEFERHLLTHHCGDPDILIRTSGEIRISNFLLWQLAYSEMFFVDKPWPAIEKADLLEIIRTYAQGRIRRYGK